MIINELAMPQQKFVKKLKGYNDQFLDHLILISCPQFSMETKKHWITELVNMCMDIDGIELKIKRKRPTESDILQFMLFDIETVNDAKFLIGSIYHNKERIHMPEDMIPKFVSCWKRFRYTLASAMSSKERHDRQFYINLFNEYINSL